VLAVALTPDADLLATVAEPADAAARDAAANGAEPAAGRVQIWRTADGVLQAELRVSARPLRSVAFTGDGSAVLTAGLDGTARLVGLDGSVRREYSIPTVKIERAILSPDARFVLGFGDAVPHLFDAATGRELLRLTGHVRSVDAAAFHPDGSAVVTASRDQTARIWPTDPVAVARRMALRPLSTAERIRFGLEPEQPPR
jgi:WD40 repeat protein